MKKIHLLVFALLLAATFLAQRYLFRTPKPVVVTPPNVTKPTGGGAELNTSTTAGSSVVSAASQPAPIQPSPAAVVPGPQPSQSPAVTAELAPASAPVVSPTTAETAATRRMYGAHASLRTPAVANPDSEQNRQILQSMVAKALARAAESGQPSATTAK